MKLAPLFLTLLLSFQNIAAFELVTKQQTATVFVPPGEPECVRLAAEDLVNDVKKITGKAPAIVQHADDAGIVMVSMNRP
ncbi:MAG: hypothetical protein HZA88_21205 [Verrucomicrobia bacterium]|nr:hypothetical protein [Verrucomicrobiota bacterium]